ncbi:NUDIX hydrolase [Candidatus Nomurabacteria bacterium]|nr:NUDIX hydrolase [Candidatus Nomurabacteria bacterium]
MDWKILEKTMEFENRHRKIEKWSVQIPSGQNKDVWVSLHPDAVIVVGIDEQDHILLVRQFFLSKMEKLYSCVAGGVQNGQTPEGAAREELLEESGYEAHELISLGKVARDKWQTGDVHYFLAKGIKKVADQHLEPLEDIDVAFVSVDECKQLLKDSQIHDIGCALGVHKALEYLDRK